MSIQVINFKIFDLDEFIIDNIHYSDIIKSRDYSIIPILYKYNNGKKLIPIIIETPEIYSPDNALEIKSDRYSYEFVLPLVCMNEESSSKLKEFFTSIDKKIINDSNTCIDVEGLSLDTKNYKPLVKKISSDEQYNDLYYDGVIKCKCINTNTIKTRFYNHIGLQLDKLNIEGKAIKLIFELDCIWIKNGKYGINMKIHQIKILNDISDTEDISETEGNVYNDHNVETKYSDHNDLSNDSSNQCSDLIEPIYERNGMHEFEYYSDE